MRKALDIIKGGPNLVIADLDTGFGSIIRICWPRPMAAAATRLRLHQRRRRGERR